MSGADNMVLAVGDRPHVPVLLDEVVKALAPVDGGIYVDGTFGAGGYTKAILDAADCRVIAIDRDPNAVAGGKVMTDAYSGRLSLVEAPFADLDRVVADAGLGAVDGVCLDIGVSSMQLDEAERGFSFMRDGPLDMRMACTGPTAADIVNKADPSVLADIFFQLGEERQSRRIARTIAARRESQPFTRTADLAGAIEAAIGRGPAGKHPATRVFQALRMFVNAELQQLARALVAAEAMLREGARLAVVTFHSLEDRLVKRFLTGRAQAEAAVSRHAPPLAAGPAATFTLPFRKAIAPSDAEIAQNARARSAHLRVGTRTAAPSRPFDMAAFGLPPVLTMEVAP